MTNDILSDMQDAGFKTGDGRFFNAVMEITQLSVRIAELEVELKQSSGLLDDALRSIHMLEDKNTCLEQLAKEMAEALTTANAHVIATHAATDGRYQRDIDAVSKAISRYREVCGGEK